MRWCEEAEGRAHRAERKAQRAESEECSNLRALSEVETQTVQSLVLASPERSRRAKSKGGIQNSNCFKFKIMGDDGIEGIENYEFRVKSLELRIKEWEQRS